MKQPSSETRGQAVSPGGARWEHFPHIADMGVRGYGASLAEAFAQTAYALIAIICEPDRIEATVPVSIRCEAPDVELLLVDWLNALIYEIAARQMLFSRFDVEISDGRLEATIWGEAVDRRRHRPVVEVKGATYTELKVCRQENALWRAQCVVDV